MILYDVRQLPRRRRQQRTTEIRVNDFWSEYNMIRPAVRASLPKAIPFHDPDSPEYVIIIPREFFSLDFVKRLTKEIMNRRFEPFRVQSQFSRNRIRPSSIPGLTPENLLMFAVVGAAAGVASVFIFDFSRHYCCRIGGRSGGAHQRRSRSSSGDGDGGRRGIDDRGSG
jgi:hypothetical protein